MKSERRTKDDMGITTEEERTGRRRALYIKVKGLIVTPHLQERVEALLGVLLIHAVEELEEPAAHVVRKGPHHAYRRGGRRYEEGWKRRRGQQGLGGEEKKDVGKKKGARGETTDS
jgi:hypothetical protein